MQYLVILRGPIASGKSTIAKRFRNFDTKTAWVKVDNFKVFFADDSSSALTFVNSCAAATTEHLLLNGFSVVMEGVFQDTTAISVAKRAAEDKNIRTIIYELRCPVSDAIKRDSTREGVAQGHRKPLGKETITKIYKRLRDSQIPGSVLLDTGSLTIDQCVEKITTDLAVF